MHCTKFRSFGEGFISLSHSSHHLTIKFHRVEQKKIFVGTNCRVSDSLVNYIKNLHYSLS